MILSMSDTDRKRMQSSDQTRSCSAIYYLGLAGKNMIATVFCAVFGCIYEHFSFGVYSNFMLYAFCVPLVLGAMPFLFMGIRRLNNSAEDGLQQKQSVEWSQEAYSVIACRLWHAGIATLTVGFLFKGILDIYGTASALTVIYWIAGGALLAGGILLKKNRPF